MGSVTTGKHSTTAASKIRGARWFGARTWTAVGAGSLVLATALVGPAQGASAPPHWPTASAQHGATLAAKARKGALRVRITGLPAGVTAKVKVKGPKRFKKTLKRTATLTKLRPGRYKVTARSVDAATGSSAPSPKRKVVTVKRGKLTKVTVHYSTSGTPGDPGGTIVPGGPPPATPVVSKGAIQQVNTDANGTGGNAEAQSGAWSPDGTKVAFISAATNLVPGVTDGCEHVYLKTLSSGQIRVVDTNASNQLGNGCLSTPGVNDGLSFSPDGSWLLFCSASSNLIQNAPMGGSDVFGKNLNTGDVEWFGPGCMRPTWSPDGTKITYMTDYEFSACGAGWPNNGNWDIVVIDRSSQLAECSDFRRVSSNDAGQQPTWSGPMDSDYPTFSPDSSKIAFASASPYLVPNDTNVSRDVFVKDLGTWKTTRVSTASDGTQAAGQSLRPAWSPDGGRIAFESAANTLVTGDTNVSEDIFVKNLASGQVSLVSTNAVGQPALFGHYAPSWSPDGSRLAWYSKAVDLVPVPNDTNTRPDVFVKNLSTGFVQLVSSTASGLQGDSWSSVFTVSPGVWSKDGTRVLFTSSSQNLSPSDGNAFAEDLFAKTVG